MPLCLWIQPTENHPFTKEVQELIADTVPSNWSRAFKDGTYKKEVFYPHVTLTSDIDPKNTFEASGQSPQEWLDGLSLPEFKKEANEVRLELDHVEADDHYYRKLTIAITPDANLLKLAAACREQAVLSSSQNGTNGTNGDANGGTAEKWAKNEYHPHMSLMYSDMPLKEVKNKIAQTELQIGYGLGSLFACCGGTMSMGATIALVDLDKPVSEWKPIAERKVDWANWRMSHNIA